MNPQSYNWTKGTLTSRTLCAFDSASIVRSKPKAGTCNINESAGLVPDVADNQIRWLPSYLRVMTTGATSYYSNMGGYVTT
ncbi:tail fiber protein / tail tubular protein A [Enterobacter phage 01_vB_Eclo_IJM]|nr:tail fiber protein / tail tubular protein A [Enterobacter phage 01_vB_Eclo_IJM]